MKQQDAIDTWWFDADEPTRARALQLARTDLLPEDMVIDLMLAGAAMVRVDTPAGVGHIIPEVLWDFLMAARQMRSRDLGVGSSQFTVHGGDLTEGYLTLNASYTT
ncbi:hypothetical protein [Kineococcus sp. SYSU DK003]|uniref:hypothetical protein n=1 Tax=Kineococcus sp. SYSU DK003 TaxID=3383124 RepID=UPI003D7CF0FE